MTKRKTISVAPLIETVNAMLKNSAPDQSDIRKGMMLVLEEVLHSSGNYKGFRYLLADEVTGNPGVNYVNGMPHPDIVARFVDTDRTRVMYF
jgi:hypothetical protein